MKAITRIVVSGVAGAGLLVAAGAAPIGPDGTVGPDDGSRVVLSFTHTGMASFMPDEKDQAFLDALRLLPVRFGEVSREMPNMDPHAASLINTALITLSRPARIALVSNPENQDGGAFGYGLIASIEVEDKRDAERLDAIVRAIASQAELPSPLGMSERFEGMSEFSIPDGGLVAFGPRETRDGWRYELLAGSVGDPDSFFGNEKETPGYERVMHLRFDAAGLDSMLEMAPMFAEGNAEAMDVIEQIQELGLTNENAVALDVSMGYTATESLAYTVFENAEALIEPMHLPTGSLSRADLLAIPQDAEFAWVSKGDFGFVSDALDDMAQSGVEIEEAIGQFKEMTGVDPVEDIVNALGGTMAMYASDTTGGGSLLSGVVLVSYQDRERFMNAMDRLVEIGNLAAAGVPIPISTAGVELTRWEHGGTDLLSLRFPGLPVPLELTAAMTENWLIFGATPQAAVAAAQQASGGSGSLLKNEMFQRSFPKDKSPVSVSFMDPTGTFRDGYPFVTMMGSGLGNLMRTPADQGRVAPMLVPLYHDLADGIRAQVEFTYWEGSDMITETHGDRSMLVNASVTAGVIARIAPALAAAGAAVGIAQRNQYGVIESVDEFASAIPSMFGPGGPLGLPRQIALAAVMVAERESIKEDGLLDAAGR